LKILGIQKINGKTEQARLSLSRLFQLAILGIFAFIGLFVPSLPVLIFLFTLILLLVMYFVVTLVIIWKNDGNHKWVKTTIVMLGLAVLLSLIMGSFFEALAILGIFGIPLTLLQMFIFGVSDLNHKHYSRKTITKSSNSDDIKHLQKGGKAYITHFDKLYAEIPNFKKTFVAKQAKHVREVYIQTHDFISKNLELEPLAYELTDYYFPQALKLLENYGEFTRKKVKVDNVQQILDNIIQSFDALCGAIDIQLNKLYAGKVLDIKTDMAVMENMVKKDDL